MSTLNFKKLIEVKVRLKSREPSIARVFLFLKSFHV